MYQMGKFFSFENFKVALKESCNKYCIKYVVWCFCYAS